MTNSMKEMKKNKAPGPDDLDINVIKEAGEPLAKELTKLYNFCLQQKRIPDVWKESELIIIHKKEDKRDMKNYRPISLLSHVYKIFTKIITKRLEKKIDEALSKDQAGFTKNYSTIDHIHTINLIKKMPGIQPSPLPDICGL